MRLYLFNHTDHTRSKYYKDVYEIAHYVTRKRFSNYSIILCNKDSKPITILNLEGMPTEFLKFKSELEDAVKTIEKLTKTG